MPSKAMFRGKQRPSGLEFPSCKNCNTGTGAADAAVAFLARIDPLGGDDLAHWHVQEARKYLRSAGSLAPGLIDEFFGEGRHRDRWLRSPGGVLLQVTEMHVGPIGQALLDVWAAKLAMALFHEHTTKPLPEQGGAYAIWFLNSGLAQDIADGFLKILPMHSTLRQGLRKSASGQFDYRYNSDDQSIVGALTHFHANIHFFTLAMAEPAKFGFPDKKLPHGRFSRPGDILNMMPQPPPAILMPSRT